MKKSCLLFTLLLGMIISLAACSDDNDNIESLLVGSWQLQEMTRNSQPESIGDNAQIIYLQANKVFKRYYTQTSKTRIGGWSYNGEMLNISLDLPKAYYVDAVDNVKLVLTSLEFDETGNVITTRTTYEKVAEN